MRKLQLLLLAVLLLAFVAACSRDDAPPEVAPPADPTPEATVPADPDPVDDEEDIDPDAIDISEFVELHMLLLGDRPGDLDLVLEEINTHLRANINAEIDISLISLADHTTMYSLRLASGEVIDIIYTSSWAHYPQEAVRGAFRELTRETISRYMPLTYAQQPWRSFEQARIQGRIYMVPANSAPLQGHVTLVREDIRIAHDLPEVVDFETFELYLETIARDEPGVFAHHSSQNNDILRGLIFNTGNNIISLPGAANFAAMRFTYGMTPSSADIYWMPDMPEYREFALLMNDWADRGFWSRSAPADSTMPRDAFENLTSGTFVHNSGTVGVLGNLLGARDIDTLAVDIFPDAYRFFGVYTGDGMAIPMSSVNWQRAMMALDQLKFDYDTFAAFRWGVEGTHWTAVGDRYFRIDNPEAQARYVFGGISWGIRNSIFERTNIEAFRSSTEIFATWTDNRAVYSPVDAFVFDATSVQTEMANLTNATARHQAILDLGLVSDVDAAIAAFRADAEGAGLEVIMEELRRQLDEYFAQ
ncbi:MAG: ABC transporter substrate-binding protein [Defluviitaleaceae bacterium]|nr:ABC transporter substrate-binding protein [Defluviitaleaceae bacterium]